MIPLTRRSLVAGALALPLLRIPHGMAEAAPLTGAARSPLQEGYSQALKDVRYLRTQGAAEAPYVYTAQEVGQAWGKGFDSGLAKGRAESRRLTQSGVAGAPNILTTFIRDLQVTRDLMDFYAGDHKALITVQPDLFWEVKFYAPELFNAGIVAPCDTGAFRITERNYEFFVQEGPRGVRALWDVQHVTQERLDATYREANCCN